jgi:hypothetical protein
VLALIGAAIWGLAIVGHPAPESALGHVAVEALRSLIMINLFLGSSTCSRFRRSMGRTSSRACFPHAPRRPFTSCGPTASADVPAAAGDPLAVPGPAWSSGCHAPVEWALGVCQAFAEWVAGV